MAEGQGWDRNTEEFNNHSHLYKKPGIVKGIWSLSCTEGKQNNNKIYPVKFFFFLA